MTTKATIPTATITTSSDDYVDGVFQQKKIVPASLTVANTIRYSFPTPLTDMEDWTEAANTFMAPGVNPAKFTSGIITKQRVVFNTLATIIPVAFTEVTESNSPVLRADIRGFTTDGVSTAQSNFPGSAPSDCDMFFGSTYHSSFDGDGWGAYGSLTNWHETGHAFGLKHAQVDNSGSGLFNIVPTGTGSADGSGHSIDKQWLAYTVMGYRAGAGGANPSWNLNDGNYSQSFMMLDIAAFQSMYGSYTTTATKTYTFDATTGEMSVDGVSVGANYASKIFRTIYYGESNCIVDVSNFSSNQTIDMRPAQWSTINSSLISAPGGTTAPGNIANAMNTTNLLKQVKTGSGTNTVRVNNAANILTGGGSDTAIFGGASTDYSHVKNGTNDYTLTDNVGSETTTRLINFDFAQFSNTTVACSTFEPGTQHNLSRGLIRLHA